MQQHTVSRDDRYHEAWPSICTAADGSLVYCYSEADRHSGGPGRLQWVKTQPGDPHEWEGQHVETAELTALGRKLLGLDLW